MVRALREAEWPACIGFSYIVSSFTIIVTA